MLDLSSWPAGMRLIVRKERPHPGAQLRFTDIDRHRFTAFATDAKKGQLAGLELRHRRRGPLRGPDPRRQGHRAAQPAALKSFAQNQLWCEIVALACELLAWTQMLALTGTARRWEPQTAPAPPVLRRRTPRPQRPPPAAQTRPALALGRPDHRRGHPPASPAGWLTSSNHHCDTEGATPGLVEPAHPARQPGSQPRSGPENNHQPNS
jgi:DDE family transposase